MCHRNSRSLVHPLRRPDRLPSFLAAQEIAFVYNPVGMEQALFAQPTIRASGAKRRVLSDANHRASGLLP
jgi:hypothetical protein